MGLGKDPLEAVKRRVYLVALLVGVPGILLTWLVRGSENPFVGLAHPALGLFCLACAWGLWTRRFSTGVIERLTFGVVAVYALTKLIYELYANDVLDEARYELTAGVYSTLSALYIIAYLVFDSRNGLRAALALYAASLAITAVRVLLDPINANPELVLWLVRTHVFMGAAIALLHALSYSKEQLARQQGITEAMRRLAHTDPLTGLPNRRNLYERLNEEIAHAARHDEPLSIILLDLDHFKRINDLHGHDAGDRTLQEFTRIVEPLTRPKDRFGRWGGEEFLVITPNVTLDQARNLADGIKATVADHDFHNVGDVTASFGLAAREPGDDPETLLKRADAALYRAKAAGRNRVEVAP